MQYNMFCSCEDSWGNTLYLRLSVWFDAISAKFILHQAADDFARSAKFCTPLSFPTPCRSPGGGGSLGQPKIFRCGSLCCCVGDCVVGHCHLYPLHSWQDILLIFTEMELATMFPPGTNVMFIRSTEEPVLVQVVGHSEHGDAYRHITYDCDGKTVLHNRASVQRLSVLQFLCLQMCVYGGGGAVPRGGGGASSLGWGTTREGGWTAGNQSFTRNFCFDPCSELFCF